MKYKITLTFLSVLSLLSLSQTVFAQEFMTLSTLAQNYVLQNNIDGITSGTVLENTTVSNPERVTQKAIEESINTVTKTVGEIEAAKKQVISDVKDVIKQDIDESIINIRKETQKPAYELQRAVDASRTELFENVTRTVEAINPTQSEQVEDVRLEVRESIQKIQDNLEAESGQEVNFERSRRSIENSLLQFEKILSEKRSLIESREGAKVFEDTDGDGLSDYDELYMYKTDPENARTVGDGKTDGQKIAEGINPLSDTEEKIQYQDPREDRLSFVSSEYSVKKVQLIKEEGIKDKLLLEGVALPNTYVTLYIYSTPIIVTVKTDSTGSWSYELEKELENGEHQMFVASVDNSGKIIARSNPILFTKTAEAASIGIAGGLNNSLDTKNFLKDNFILISIALLIVIVILAMMFAGNHSNIKSAVQELKNEVNQRY